MLPYAGGSACSFRELRARLMTRAHVWSIDYPGRGALASRPGCQDIQDMARAVVAMLADGRHEEVTLWGYSLGAIVAIEVIRQLEQAGSGCRIKHLVAAACRPPHLFQVKLPRDLSDEAFLAAIGKLGCLPSRIQTSPRVLARLLPHLRADLEAASRYRHDHAPTRHVPITVLGGRGDPLVPLHDLAAWQTHTQAGCRPYVFGGDHFFVHQHIDAVADIVLNAACAGDDRAHASGRPARFDSDARRTELIQ
jgi:surfactin synthase thioesterase subunit